MGAVVRNGFFLALASLAFIIVFVAYLPSVGSTTHFDDSIHLDPLEEVSDIGSALSFVFSGTAGPLGRPISLASFLFHKNQWPDNLRPILLTNVGIHFFNGLLLAFFTYLIARVSPVFSRKDRALSTAIGVAAIWLALPLLASSNLFIIQRMATLATSFVLVGLCLHFAGRHLIETRPKSALVLMSSGVFTGFFLGSFSKESALVYPLLVLILDRTLLSGVHAQRSYIWWRRVFIVAPSILFFLYLLHRLASGEGFEHRHFTAGERAITQAVVLFEYLRLLFVPDAMMLGPFHDHYPLFGGAPKLVALLLGLWWIALATGSIIWSGRWPIGSFVVLWFLASHLLESTWIPLEMYYEHRNYLATTGVVLGIGLYLGQLSRQVARLLFPAIAVYFIAQATVLAQVTSPWGDPRLAASIWWEENMESQRAAHFLARYLIDESRPVDAAKILGFTSNNDPTQLFLDLEALKIHCLLGDELRSRRLFESILERAPYARYVNRSPDNDVRVLESLIVLAAEERCRHVSLVEFDELASAYLEGLEEHGRSSTVHNYFILRSKVAYHLQEPEAVMEFILKALEREVALDTALIAARTAAELGHEEWLDRIIEILSSRAKPWHPLQRVYWKKVSEEILRLREDIDRSGKLLE